MNKLRNLIFIELISTVILLFVVIHYKEQHIEMLIESCEELTFWLQERYTKLKRKQQQQKK